MKITFPQMGNLSIPLESIFNQLGFEVVLPPTTRKTICLGAKYSPEQICLPFKIILGNLLEGYRQGADTIVMLGGCGPCRFGFYGNLLNDILQDMGLEFKFIYFDEDILKTLHQCKSSLRLSWLEIFKALSLSWSKLALVEYVDELACQYRPIYCNNDLAAFEHSIAGSLQAIRAANTLKELQEIKSDLATNIYFCNPVQPNQFLKVALIGDIYTLLEPQCNYNIIKELGNRGIQVVSTVRVSSWLKSSIIGLERTKEGKSLIAYAKPYLKEPVGGHGLHSVANSNMLSSQVDGMVQLMPLTCTPEIVAASIIPAISSEKNIPILKLFVDEHAGDVGFITRMEAFIDMLHRKNEKKKVNSFEYVNRRSM